MENLSEHTSSHVPPSSPRQQVMFLCCVCRILSSRKKICVTARKAQDGCLYLWVERLLPNTTPSIIR